MMRKILVAAAAPLLLGTVAAHADVVDVTGSYTLSDTMTLGNAPSLGHVVSDPFSEDLTVGASPTSATRFFSVSPAGSCGRNCGRGDTASGTITVDFSINTPDGTQKISDTAAYTADYKNDTDSVVWTTNDLVVAYSSLLNLDITLGNAQDWTIYPTISFDLVDAPPPTTDTPEPGSFALLGTGLLGLFGVTRLRRKAV
ncbi:MAG TPA: PEP-CTERM sorting domain-containing protein [Acetobacteraceae bacterium]|nr:PEP-CTERM sorting domain-containing protein [Acetobacteraceae bacterium]